MATYRAKHRRQAAEGTWAAKYGCTAVSALVAMDQATRGRVGPAITADQFRGNQPDQEGGIDLHDARIAANYYGVSLEVRASYGGTTPATWSDFTALGHPTARRALIVQGDHDRLPGALRCAGFLGDHAVMSSGWQIVDGTRVWDISNPLCAGWVTWPDHVMKAYVEAFAGSNRAYVAAAPPTSEEEMLAVVQDIERYPSPRHFTVSKGTTLNGYDPAQPGKVVKTFTAADDTGARAIAAVAISWPGTVPAPIPRGGPFLLVADGTLAGLYIVGALVTLSPTAPPATGDCSQAVADAVAPLKAEIEDLKDQVMDAELDARRTEYDRLKAAATVSIKVELPERP